MRDEFFASWKFICRCKLKKHWMQGLNYILNTVTQTCELFCFFLSFHCPRAINTLSRPQITIPVNLILDKVYSSLSPTRNGKKRDWKKIEYNCVSLFEALRDVVGLCKPTEWRQIDLNQKVKKLIIKKKWKASAKAIFSQFMMVAVRHSNKTTP